MGRIRVERAKRDHPHEHRSFERRQRGGEAERARLLVRGPLQVEVVVRVKRCLRALPAVRAAATRAQREVGAGAAAATAAVRGRLGRGRVVACGAQVDRLC